MSRLFKASEDWLPQLSNWLDIQSISKLDIAVASVRERPSWLSCLKSVDAKAIDEYGHSISSIKWLIRREISVRRIQFSRNRGRHLISMDTFVGLRIPFLQSIDFSNCMDYSDAALLAVVNRCSHLETASFRGCTSITDATISALVARCPQLSR